MKVTVGVVGAGYWRDIGTPQSLAGAHFDILDGRLETVVPPSLRIDRSRKYCFPAAWGDRPPPCGPYCWVEEPSWSPAPDLERAVIMRGAVMHADSSAGSRNVLFTPWGEIRFDG
jgi:hypothetical protein